jgi:hypothetical protein
MHFAPTFSQNEQDGFLLSHFVRRALQTWQALFARLRGYAAVPRGAGRLRAVVVSSVLRLISPALSDPDTPVPADIAVPS